MNQHECITNIFNAIIKSKCDISQIRGIDLSSTNPNVYYFAIDYIHSPKKILNIIAKNTTLDADKFATIRIFKNIKRIFVYIGGLPKDCELSNGMINNTYPQYHIVQCK